MNDFNIGDTKRHEGSSDARTPMRAKEEKKTKQTLQ